MGRDDPFEFDCESFFRTEQEAAPNRALKKFSKWLFLLDFSGGDGLRVKPRRINSFQRVDFRIRQQIRQGFVALYSLIGAAS